MTQANSNGAARENETPAVTVGALHANQTSSGATIEPYVVHAESEIAAGQAKYSLRAVSRFKWTFLVIFLVIGVTGTAASWILIKPKYEATAQLDAEPRRIPYRDENGETREIDGLFKTYIKATTDAVSREIDWLVSVFGTSRPPNASAKIRSLSW